MTSDFTDIPDAELMLRWRNGDRGAGLALSRRYYKQLERFFASKVSSNVADLVQDTFVALLESSDRLEQPDRFRAYVYSIAFNMLRMRFRKLGRRGAHIDIDEVSAHDLSPGPITLLTQHEQQRLLLEALRRIPVADQILIELHYWKKLKLKEIAPIIECPLPTVKGRLKRARVRLREHLERLSSSRQLVDSTMTGIDSWAASLEDLGVAKKDRN